MNKKGFDLINRMRQVDLSQPNNSRYKPISEGDTPVGMMSEDLQRLDHVRSSFYHEKGEIESNAKNMVLEHYQSHRGKTEHDCDLFNQQIKEVMDSLRDVITKCVLINEIFWAMVYLEFPETADKKVGLRDGNQVVFEKESIDDTIVNAESALFDHFFARI